jgi:hypothetical protein
VQPPKGQTTDLVAHFQIPQMEKWLFKNINEVWIVLYPLQFEDLGGGGGGEGMLRLSFFWYDGPINEAHCTKIKKRQANKQVWRCTTSNLSNQYESP